MYVVMIIALLLVFPLISIVAQAILTGHDALSAAWILAVTAKWYVFWAVGVRLSLAGLRQIIQPRYTAETILGFKSAESLFFVRELGFANVSIGSVGIASLFAPAWVAPAALAGALFYGLAGINHCFHRERNSTQNLAMASDLFAAVLLAVSCLA